MRNKKMTKLKFTAKTDDNHFKVYINGLIHLCIKTDDIIGIQSWMEPDETSRYYIKFYTKTANVVCKYNDLFKWKSMLQLIDKQQFWAANDLVH